MEPEPKVSIPIWYDYSLPGAKSWTASVTFQFQSGTITARWCNFNISQFGKFQFQSGAITAWGKKHGRVFSVKFQFQSGAITAKGGK